MESTNNSTSDQEIMPDSTKKKRKRVITSCTECSRRKQKCNREWPCNHCLNRRAAQLCRYGTGLEPPKLDENKSDERSKNEIRQPHGVRASLERPSFIPPGSNESNSASLLKEIGFQENGSTSILGSILHAGSLEDPLLSPTSPRSDHRRLKEEVLNVFPQRQVVDFLIQNFLDEVNWLYEEIFPPTFLQKYNAWWSQTDYDTKDDIQFGVLILRLCANSLQFLPPESPAQNILRNPVDTLERFCNSAACKLDESVPRKSSLLRVQQMLFHIATLTNSGDTRESYHVLGEAVTVARDIDLYLEEKWRDITEFEKEERRKTFWNLYAWDRFYCTFLGRWPLIPDLWFDVKLPLEKPYSSTASDPSAPTPFTDVLLCIRVCQFMESFISAPAKKAERLDPAAISAHAQRFQEEFIDKLPSAYRLQNPNTQWDTLIPCLPKKRAAVHVMVWAVIESVHRGFVGPPISKDPGTGDNSPGFASLRQKWAESHRKMLANASINVVDAIISLHTLMGGGPHRYFMLSLAPVEAGAVLGMCLISDASASKSKSERVFAFDQELQKRCYASFLRARTLLELLAQRSRLAQKGVILLRKLNTALLAEGYGKIASGLTSTSTQGLSSEGLGSNDHTALESNIGGGAYSIENDMNFSGDQGSFTWADWEFISQGVDFSWAFEDAFTMGGSTTNDFNIQ